MATPVTYEQAGNLYNNAAITYEGGPLGLHGWITSGIAAFYIPVDEYGFALECTVGNAVVAPFLALLDTADDQMYDDRGPVTTHTLRYLATTSLKTGDLIYCDGAQYTVTHTPQRINREEMRARLILNP